MAGKELLQNRAPNLGMAPGWRGTSERVIQPPPPPTFPSTTGARVRERGDTRDLMAGAVA